MGRRSELPGYEVLKVLGEGAFGRVLQARSERLGRLVAIKVLKEGATDPQIKARFLREAKILVAAREEGLIPILDAELEGEAPYLVLPWMAGGDLLTRIKDRGPAPAEEVLQTGRRLASALGVLHRNAIVHRDIKPANVLLDEKGEAYLADLGLGRAEKDETLTQTGHMVGTPRYMAPELLAGFHFTPPSDVFALGVLLVELRLGRTLPGLSGSDSHLGEALETLEPKALRHALRELVRIRADDRPQDGYEAAALLVEAGAEPASGGAAGAGATATLTEVLPRPLTSGAYGAGGSSGRITPAAGAGAGGRLFRIGLLAGIFSVLGIGFLLGQRPPGPEPDEPDPGGLAGPVRPAGWPGEAWAQALLDELDRLDEATQERLSDPLLFPELVRTLPAMGAFFDWVSRGGLLTTPLDDPARARLAALDERLRQLGLPVAFAGMDVGPADGDPIPAGPTLEEHGDTTSPVILGHPGATGWFKTAVLAQRALGQADNRLQAALEGKGEGAALPPELAAHYQELKRTLTFNKPGRPILVAELANVAFRAGPRERRIFCRWAGEAITQLQRMIYAVAMALRLEPGTADRLATLFCRWSGFGSSGYHSHLLRLAPDALSFGPPASPAQWMVRTSLLRKLSRLPGIPQDEFAALAEAEKVAMVEALALPRPDDPAGATRLHEAARYRLDRMVHVATPEEVLELWRTRVLPVAQAYPWVGGAFLTRMADLSDGMVEPLRILGPTVAEGLAHADGPRGFFLAPGTRAVLERLRPR